MAYQDEVQIQNALLGLLTSPQGGGLSIPNASPEAQRAIPEDQAQRDLIAELMSLATRNTAVRPSGADLVSPQANNLTNAQYAEYTARLPQPVIPTAPLPYYEPTAVDEEISRTNSASANNAGAQRVNAASLTGQYKPSQQALDAGASNNQVRAYRDSKGKITLTNVGTPQYEGGNVVGLDATNNSTFSVNSVREAVKELADPSKVIDSADFARKFGSLTSSVEAVTKGILDTSRNAQRVTLGIPSLEQDLVKAQQMDLQDKANNPAAVPMRAMAIQQEIIKREKLAEDSAKLETSRNTTVSALTTEMDKVRPEIQIYGQRVGLRDNNAIQDALVAESFSPTQMTNLETLNNSAKGNPSALGGLYKKYDNVEKDFIAAKPQDLPKLYLANPEVSVGRDLLVAQLKSSGKSDEDSMRIISRMKSLSNDPISLRKVASKMMPAGFVESNPTLFTTAQASNKEENLMRKLQRADLVLAAINAEETANFTSNAIQWLPVGDPNIKSAVDAVRVANKDTTLANIATAYISQAATPEERRIRRSSLTEMVKATALGKSKGSIGALDVNRIVNEIPMTTGESRLGQFGGYLYDSTIGPVLNSPYSPVENAIRASHLVSRDIGNAFSWMTEDTAL